jgi:hypothetical protein
MQALSDHQRRARHARVHQQKVVEDMQLHSTSEES